MFHTYLFPSHDPAGALGGLTNPYADEEAQHQRALAEQEKKVGMEQALLNAQLGVDAKIAQIENTKTNTEATSANTYYKTQVKPKQDQMRLELDALEGEQKRVLEIWKELETFDMSSDDPQVKRLIEQAEQAGVTLLNKERGKKYFFSWSPDGRPTVMEEGTGEYTIGDQSYSRPKTISASRLTDDLFGLPSNAEIADKAKASIGRLPKERRLRAGILDRLSEEERTDANGRVLSGAELEDKVINDIYSGESSLRFSDIYEDIPYRS